MSRTHSLILCWPAFMAAVAAAPPALAGGQRSFRWAFARRGYAEASGDGLVLRGKLAYLRDFSAGAFKLECAARAFGERPEIWLRFFYRDPHDHYALALRGHVCQDVYLFRFRPAGDRLVALENLPFELLPGKWYRLSVGVRSGFLEVAVDGRPVLRKHIASTPSGGSIAFGGCPCRMEVRKLQIRGLRAAAVETAAFSPNAIKLNFGPADAKLPPGWRVSDDSSYDGARGWGWLTRPTGVRRRGVEADPLTDTLVAVAHGTGEGIFRLDLPDGDYLLTAMGGDPSFPARLEWWLNDEPQPWVEENLPSRVYRTWRRPVTVRGGYITLRVVSNHPRGQPGGVINWLVVEPREEVGENRWGAAAEAWKHQRAELERRRLAEERERARRRRLRREQRRAYRPCEVPGPTRGRTVVSLDGIWLFLPDQERRPGEQPWSPDSSDRHWHTIPVPAFWQPVRWWIFGGGSGVSDNWRQAEEARCDAFTFAWRTTEAGWYRHWFRLPASYRGKRILLRFQGVAMACQVWVNGQRVARHVGMFGPWQVDITRAVKPGGLNLLAVLVTRKAYEPRDPERVVGVAVTVELTNRALNSVPHGMYGAQGGIWGPVELVATSAVHLRDVFFKPRLDGGDLEVEIGGAESASGQAASSLRLAWRLTERRSGKVVTRGSRSLEPGVTSTAVRFRGLHVKPWWPEKPCMYRLELQLAGAGGQLLDREVIPIGFRTVEVRGNRIYLNGRAYWLRGANHAPNGLRPWDGALAHRFLRLMHQGHQYITRTHGSPFTRVWLEAADTEGVGVSVEGIWPWALYGSSPIPDPALLEVWREDWLAVMRAARNHPSVLMGTVNNEMYFYRDRDADRRRRKWEIISDLIAAMRRLDPTRPVVVDSGYVRTDRTRRESVLAGLDDGDIDDAHRYYGWYSIGPLWLFGRKMEEAFRGDRPAISQEFSTGYPNVDTGHPTRMYIDRNQVAQTWVGNWAYEDRDPGYFLSRHAWLTKELAELGRREAKKLCGLLHFATCTWVQHCYDAERMKPFPTYAALKTALQPVLVSWESKQRHFYAGAELAGRVWVVNDDIGRDTLRSVKVTASVVWQGHSLARAAVQLGDVPYYERTSAPLHLRLPRRLTADRCDAELVLMATSAGRTVSRNSYPLLLARRSWTQADVSPLAPARALSIIKSGTRRTLVIEGDEALAGLAEDAEEVRAWLKSGGTLVALNAGSAAARLFPEAVSAYVARRTETANPWTEDAAVFDGLKPTDIAWMMGTDGKVRAADGFFRLRSDTEPGRGLGVRRLATTMRAHAYLSSPADIVRRNLWGTCLVEIAVGRGRAVLSTLNISGRNLDPVAGRLYRNIVHAYALATGSG